MIINTFLFTKISKLNIRKIISADPMAYKWLHINYNNSELFIQDANCLFTLIKHNDIDYGVVSIYSICPSIPKWWHKHIFNRISNYYIIYTLVSLYKNTKLVIIVDYRIDLLNTTQNAPRNLFRYTKYLKFYFTC